MRDREYDKAKFEIEMANDELMYEWLLHKMGRRAEVLFNGEENQPDSWQENSADDV